MFSSEAWLANPSSGFYNGVATQSLRTDHITAKNLSRTPSSESNKRTFTFSTWLKRSHIDYTSSETVHQILSSQVDGNDYFAIYFQDDGKLYVDGYHTSQQLILVTNRLFRDTSAWYHLVVAVDTTQGTNTNRVKIYVNGVQETSFSTATYPSQNYDTYINDDVKHTLASSFTSDSQRFGGYFAETNLVDGTQLSPTSFGETKNGVWIAKKYTGSYGTNGFRFKFDQVGVGTASTSTIGADTSGNNNHFTSTNIVASDCNMPDSPENNFSTLNALDNFGYDGVVLSEGNLKGASTQGHWDVVRSTFVMPTGSWYVELLSLVGIGNGNIGIGIIPQNEALPNQVLGASGTAWAYLSNGNVYNGGSTVGSTGATFSVTSSSRDIVAMTFDGSTVKWYKNNSLIHTVGSIPSNDYAIGLGFYDTDESGIINFGQDPTFAGVQDSSTSAKTPSNSGAGTADSEGNGKFFYAPPSGFLALCSANLPEPTIGPNSDTQANDHFSSALFTGTSGDVDVAVPFKPDWVWIKARSDAQGHSLVDSSRGGTKLLQSNTDGLENSVNSGNDVNEIHFTVDGFTSNTDWHTNNYTYVSWNWKANGNTTSTIAVDSVSSGVPSIASTVQANTTAGFSIVTYSGNADASATIGHGLGKTPKLIFAKQRDEAGNWIGYNEVTGATNKLNLNQTTGSAESALWNDTAPTDKVFSVKDTSSEDTFGDGHTYVAYCFTDVEGYSKFGKYTGNGATSATNSDGTFAFLGFRPAFIMIKNTSASAEWVMIDSVRSTFNEVDKILSAEATSDEDDYVYANRNIDFLSNGFKIRNTQAGGSTALNTSNHIYFYMAFAEAPFKYANAR